MKTCLPVTLLSKRIPETKEKGKAGVAPAKSRRDGWFAPITLDFILLDGNRKRNKKDGGATSARMVLNVRTALTTKKSQRNRITDITSSQTNYSNVI